MITDFLKTKRPKKDLKITLEVLKEFKSCESWDEYLEIWFSAWAKLEQFEEYLEHLVNGKPLQQDTIDYMRRQNETIQR
jgi:hypothetical protein